MVGSGLAWEQVVASILTLETKQALVAKRRWTLASGHIDRIRGDPVLEAMVVCWPSFRRTTFPHRPRQLACKGNVSWRDLRGDS